MKNRITKIILITLFISINFLLVACANEENIEDSIFINIIEGNEIADIVYFKGYLYAGGMEGVFKINPNDYSYEKIDIGEVFLVKDLIIDDDYLYIGHDGGIIIYDGQEYDSILDKTSMVQDIRVNYLMFDNETNLWVGTYSGVLINIENKWNAITTDDGLMANTVFLIMQDSYGGIIFGHYASSNCGVSYLKNNEWTYFTVDEGLPHNYVTAGIEVDNKLYLTTGFYDVGGIAIFDILPDDISISRNIVREWGKYGSKARSINIDNDLLWIGTEYNGVCIMKGEEFVKFDIDDGLISNEVKSIYFDEQGMVWLGTKKGISIVNKLEIYKEINF